MISVLCVCHGSIADLSRENTIKPENVCFMYVLPAQISGNLMHTLTQDCSHI